MGREGRERGGILDSGNSIYKIFKRGGSLRFCCLGIGMVSRFRRLEYSKVEKEWCDERRLEIFVGVMY